MQKKAGKPAAWSRVRTSASG